MNHRDTGLSCALHYTVTVLPETRTIVILPAGRLCDQGQYFSPNQNNVLIHKLSAPLQRSYSNCGLPAHIRILLYVSRLLTHFQDCNFQHSCADNSDTIELISWRLFFSTNWHCCIIGPFIIQFCTFIFVGKFHNIHLIFDHTE